MLQINAPEASAPGGPWAADVLRFFVGGREVGLEYDELALDRFGRHLAAPVVTGTDGNDYNISIVMVFIGMARSAYYGDNHRFLQLARAAEAYARAACWNMWGAGNPWAEESGCS